MADRIVKHRFAHREPDKYALALYLVRYSHEGGEVVGSEYLDENGHWLTYEDLDPISPAIRIPGWLSHTLANAESRGVEKEIRTVTDLVAAITAHADEEE